MKRPVSLFVPIALSVGLLAACGAEAAGKDEFASICQKRMKSVEKCACYVDSIEQALSDDQFARLAQGAHQNRDYAGADWVPHSVRSEPAISQALDEATSACFVSA